MKSLSLPAVTVLTLCLTGWTRGHDLGGDPGRPHYDWSVKPPEGIQAPEWFFAQVDAGGVRVRSATTPALSNRPLQAAVFQLFAPLVKVRWDERYLYVEDHGLPAHNMMVGITNWQQQVPLPQAYTGNNAWRIPLAPAPAKTPLSIRGRFLRGAIAIAANGIPIFNPQNNRGEISAEIGELDQWGGHCGRADDYHYHAAPLHLQSVVGKDKPIAYALDGYPIYGLLEPDGSQPAGLDSFNGHATAALGYHYHASTKYPYVNGGFHGEVAEAGGQVDPQPRAQSVRPALPPLRGARITGFTAAPDDKGFALNYTVSGKPAAVKYVASGDGGWKFQFLNADGTERVESYRAGGSGDPQGGPPPEQSDARPKNSAEATPGVSPKPSGLFVLRSAAVADHGALPVEFTGDGPGSTLPLEWSGAPAGTKSYALLMHHLDPEGVTKSYWILHHIPANVTSLPKNVKGVGVLGASFKGIVGYEPPHSKGPGAKTYVLTLYALSEAPEVTGAPERVTYDAMLAAMKGKVLASADLSVVYSREGASPSQGRLAPPARNPDGLGQPSPSSLQPGAGGAPSAPPGAAPGGPRKPWLQEHGAELDANHDGVITLSEMLDDMSRAFVIYARNQDGVITAEELKAAGDAREGAAFAGLILRRFADLDTNGDGSVSREEAIAAAKAIFTGADLDHDGKLTADEWKNAPNTPLGIRPGGQNGNPLPRAQKQESPQ